MAKQITEFNRSNLREIRDIIDGALKDALEEYGLTAKMGNISFSGEDFTTKVTVSCGSDDEAAQREWDKHAYKFGMESSDFGKTFMVRGKPYTVSGIKPRSSKYPIIAKDEKGKAYKFPPHMVK